MLLSASAIGATALVSIAAVQMARFGLKEWRRYQSRLPIVERVLWRRGECVVVMLSVRNRLEETLVVDEAVVHRPPGACLSTESIFLGGRWDPVRGNAATVALKRQFAPDGILPAPGQRPDRPTLSFTVWPSADWRGGMVEIGLKVWSKGGSLKPRTIVLRQRV